jgi:autotransporter-associated beta strand protein
MSVASHRFVRIVLVVALAPFSASSAVAQTFSWGATGTGGTGTWDSGTTANWFNGAAVAWPTSGTGAVFGAPNQGTYTVTAVDAINAQSLSFVQRNYTLTGGTITLASSTTPTITLAVSGTPSTTTINSVLAGSQGLAIVGVSGSAQSLVLGGSNTFTGNTVISGSGGTNVNITTRPTALGSGTVFLSVSNPGLVNVLTATNMNFSNPIVFVGGTAGGRQALTASGTLSGPISITGTIPAQHGIQTPSVTGTSLLVSGNITGTTTAPISFRANSSGATITFSGTYNNPAAALDINSGNLNLVITSTGHSYASLAMNAGTITLGTNAALSGTSAAIFTSAASPTLALNGFNATIAGLTGTFAASGTATIRNGAGLGSNSVLTLANLSGTNNFFGQIVDGAAGTLALVFNAPGRRQVLSGSNSYSGGTTVVGGTLQVNNASALGASTAPLAVTTGTLDLNGFSPTVGTLSGSTGGVITSVAAATLTGSSASNSTYGGAFTGAVGFTKAGSGLLTLTGSSTNTGATTVAGGTLAVDGVFASSLNSVSVSSGAVLQGTGTIAGAVSVIGTLSPGNSPGVITLGSVVLGGSSSTIIEINDLIRGTQYDGVNISGTSSSLTYGGDLSISFGNASPFAEGTTFDIFNFTGGYLGDYASVVSTGFYSGTWSSLGSGTFQLASGGQTLQFSEVTGDLVVLVPEPAALAVCGLGVVGIVAVIRRRRRAA